MPSMCLKLLPCLALTVWTGAAASRTLSGTENRIVAAIDAHTEPALALLAETVNVQSATENLAGVRAVGDIYAREFRALGFETKWVELPPAMHRAGHFVATHRGKRGPGLLLIGHLDTVLQGEPFRRDGTRGYGTGSSDMKGGNLIVLEALRALQSVGALRNMKINVVFTGDEEDTGSPQSVSREALFAAAKPADVALAFEGAAPGKGAIGRRGIGSWRLHVTGQQAHSSGIFSDNRGYGAIFEAARIVEQFRTGLREPNLTYNPSVIVGGTNVTYDPATKSGTALGKTNVIPREVRVEGDIRYLGAAQLESARQKMQAIVAQHLPLTSAELEIENEYPSMAPNPGSERVLGVLDEVSRDLGAGPIVAQPPIERGAGDIAFVCEDGRLACLDGLGAVGDHEHAPGEYIELDALPMQVKRAALLMYRLTR
jgi:glutamate carboxypeptidase